MSVVSAALSRECCHLPAAAVLFVVPYAWPGWFSCCGLVFMLLSLPVCFPAQPRERLCQWQEQDEGGKDAGKS